MITRRLRNTMVAGGPLSYLPWAGPDTGLAGGDATDGDRS
jgi:hypothetical protein